MVMTSIEEREYEIALAAGLDPVGPERDAACLGAVRASARTLAAWGRATGRTTRVLVRALACAQDHDVVVFTPTEKLAIATRRRLASLAALGGLDASRVRVAVTVLGTRGAPQGTRVLYDPDWHEFAPLAERIAALQLEAQLAGS